MTNDNAPYFMSGLAGFILAMAVAWFGIVGDARSALVECEAELPRDQHCVITAVPAEE